MLVCFVHARLFCSVLYLRQCLTRWPRLAFNSQFSVSSSLLLGWQAPNTIHTFLFWLQSKMWKCVSVSCKILNNHLDLKLYTVSCKYWYKNCLGFFCLFLFLTEVVKHCLTLYWIFFFLSVFCFQNFIMSWTVNLLLGMWLNKYSSYCSFQGLQFSSSAHCR